MEFNEIIKTTTDAKNFVKGLIHLSKVDGIVTEEERNYFLQVAITLGLSSDEIKEIEVACNENNEIQFDFDSRLKKIFFIREAIQLCSIDGGYTDDEKQEIEKISKHFNVERKVVDIIENWVEEGMDWKKRGDSILIL